MPIVYNSYKGKARSGMLELLYTVQPTDEAEGLLGIARRLFGDISRWSEIYEASQSVIGSNPNVIHQGQQLVLPLPDDRQLPRDGLSIYVVEPKDLNEGLRSIAGQVYDNQEMWPEIYAINRGIIGDDPTHIHCGQ